MRISAKADYALRAGIELAGATADRPLAAARIAAAQQIPSKFLESILTDLGRAGLVTSQRGPGGGHRLARPADQITVADVVRAVEGPLVWVRDERPGALGYEGSAAVLMPLWVGLRASVRGVLEGVSLADLARAELPKRIVELTADPAAWQDP